MSTRVGTTAMSESVLGFSRVIVTFPVRLVTWFCLAINNNNTYTVHECINSIIGWTRVFKRIYCNVGTNNNRLGISNIIILTANN